MTRRAPRTGWTRAAIAAAMAYAFVLQLVLLSVSGAFHAAAAAEAQGIICVQDGSSAPDHGPKKAHENLCCTVSCHGAGATGPAPVAAILERIAPVQLPPTFPAMRPTYASHPLSCLWDRARRRASAELPTIDSNLFCQDVFS